MNGQVYTAKVLNNSTDSLLLRLALVFVLVASPFCLPVLQSEQVFAAGTTVSVSDETELRIAIANAPKGVPTTIELTQDIQLSTAALLIPAVKTIILTGDYRLIGVNGARVIENSGTLTIDGITVCYGTGVSNKGTLTLKSGAISGNSGEYGCGVYNQNGNFTMSGGTIANNNAMGIYSTSMGGGVCNSQGTFTLRGGSIVNNSADIGGGVANIGGTFTMSGGTIEDNTAVKNNGMAAMGGGVYSHYSKFTMSGGTISNNSADIGGGVYNTDDYSGTDNGTFTMSKGTISNNTAKEDGGGIYTTNYTKLKIGKKAKFADNFAGRGVFLLTSADKTNAAIYKSNITCTQWTSPYRIGFNNYDINYSTIVRIAGAERFETAAKVSQTAFPTPSDNQTAIVAFGYDFPDALAASALAGCVKAPVLLTGTKKLDPYTKAELTRLQVKKVYIVGGTSVVSEKVAQDIQALSTKPKVKRLWGQTQYDTAYAIAKEAIKQGASSTDMFLCNGENFQDALAISSYAASQKIPILLTGPSKLSSQAGKFVKTYKPDTVYIIGGESVVSYKAFDSLLHTYRVPYISRFWGNEWQDTALDVASRFYSSENYANVGIATGENFPDALSGGAALGVMGGALLLTKTDSLTLSASIPLSNIKMNHPQVYIIGGTSVVTPAVEKAIRAITGG